MTKTLLTLILFISVFLTVNGQKYIYVGDNQYQATESWCFAGVMNGLGGKLRNCELELTVAKSKNGGYLMIEGPYIKGTLKIFLSDGSVIKCLETGKRDHVNNNDITLFNFTKAEIEILKQKRIMKIRYTTIDFFQITSDYTVDNQVTVMNSTFGLYQYGTDIEKEENSCNCYATEYYISELFKE